MSAPERLHIVLNAADGHSRFEQSGIATRIGEDLTTEAVEAMLANQISRLFRLGGWVVGTHAEVLLRVNNLNDGVIYVNNEIEPPFEGGYLVATKPPPHVSEPHGDFVFELVQVE